VQAIKGSKDTLEVLSSKSYRCPDEDLAGSTVCWFYLFLSLASAKPTMYLDDRWCFLFLMKLYGIADQVRNSCRICSWSPMVISPPTSTAPYLIYACASKSDIPDANSLRSTDVKG